MNRKIFLSFFLFLLTSVAVMAQYQLPDPGFEDWSGTPFDGKIQTAHWHFSNVSNVIKVNFAERVPGRTGDYAAKVQDRAMQALGINFGVSPGYFALGYPWVYVPGTDGDAATAGTRSGISWTSRPDSVVVWIKREGANVMRENYNIVFYSWRGTAFAPSYPSNKGCTAIPESTCGVKGGGIEDEESDIRIALDANGCGTQRFATQVAECYFFERAEYTDWTRLCIPVYYLCDSVPEKCNLIFSAGNYPAGKSTAGLYAGNSMTVDDVELIYSSKIQKLFIGNKEWKSFDPNSSEEQTYSLGVGASAIPAIYAMRGAGSETNCNGQSATFSGRRLTPSECVINTANASVDGEPVEITVYAEDGSSSTTYRIKFVSEPSHNPRLSDIRVNGSTIPGFNTYLTNYSVSLPFGTEEAPLVECTPVDAGTTYVITQPTSPTGSAHIACTAQDGVVTTHYDLTFQVAPLTDVTLQDILLDGVSLPGFSPAKTTYNVSLPLSTTSAPQVTPVSAYPDGAQTITILQNSVDLATATGLCQIEVRAPGAILPKVYKLNYRIEASANNRLAGIALDGVPFNEFTPEQTSYVIDLPEGTTSVPVLTYTAGDEYQSIAMTTTGNVVKIVVTAGNGDKLRYTFTFNMPRTASALLNMIYLDGDSLPNFQPEHFAYSVVITGQAPVLTVDKQAGQAVEIISPSGVGVATITVHSEVGDPNVYTLRFISEDAPLPAVLPSDSMPLFSVTTLKAIHLDGDLLADFEPTKTDYSVLLPYGTLVVPTISVEAHDYLQQITITTTNMDSLGTIRACSDIRVEAENGDTLHYLLHFSVAPAEKENVLLSILVDGQGALDLALGDTFMIDLAYEDTVGVQVLSYTKNYPEQKVILIPGGVCAPTQICVKAGREGVADKVYTLVPRRAKYDDAMLLGITVDGIALDGFSPDVYNYVTSVTQEPVVAYQLPTGATATVLRSDEHGFVVEVSTDRYHHTYTISYHYLSSVIPNTDFSSWSPTRYNKAQKPTGWNVAADFYASYFVGSEKTGDECRPAQANEGHCPEASDAVNTVNLNMFWHGGVTLCPAMGLMTLGTLEMKYVLMNLGNSSRVYGGIPYVNTPDTLLLSVKPVAQTRNNKWRFLYNTKEGSAWREHVYEGNYANLCDWQTAILPVTYGEYPDSVNIIINAGPSENNDDYEGVEQHSEIRVRDLRLRYCSTLREAYLVARMMHLSGNRFTDTIAESCYVGQPDVRVVGDVLDQQQSPWAWSDWTPAGAYMLRTAMQVNYGENGLDQSSYQFLQYRPCDTVATVGYRLSDEGDLTIVRRSPYQKVSVSYEDFAYTIVVTPEQGSSVTYRVPASYSVTCDTITLDATLFSSNAYLSTIEVNAEALADYEEDLFDYLLQHAQPATFEPIKAEESQEVTPFVIDQGNGYTTYIFVVRAEDGTTSVYTVQEEVHPLLSDAYLENILVDGVSLTGFRSDSLDYVLTLPYTALTHPEFYFVPTAGATVVVTSDSALIRVHCVSEDKTAWRDYTITLERELSPVSSLQMIYLDEQELASFDENVSHFQAFLPYGASLPIVTAEPTDPHATVRVDSLDALCYEIVCTAEDGEHVSRDTLCFSFLPSENTWLNMIFVDGDSLSGFEEDEDEYMLVLPYGTTALPTITWATQDEQQVVVVDTVSDSMLQLVVTSGSGDTFTYTLTFPIAPCDNWHLSDLRVRGVTVTDFQRDSLYYVLVYPVGTQEEDLATATDVLAIPEESTTQVVVASDDHRLLITSTAESGAFNIYVIEQQILYSSYIKEIDLNGVAIPSFDATVQTYDYMLQQGQSIPEVTAVPEDSLADVFVSPGENDTVWVYCVSQSGEERAYAVVFHYAPYVPGESGDADDCLFYHLPGTNTYMAFTIRTDVYVLVCDVMGHRLMWEPVPVCDPNYVRVETDEDGNLYIAEVYPGAEGPVFEADYHKTYFALFYRGNKRLAKGMKFMLVP